MIQSKSLTNSSKTTYIALFLFSINVVFFVIGCGHTRQQQEGFSILSSIPMDNTAISYYLTIETLYRSDQNIVIMTDWDASRRSEKQTLKWEIIKENGDTIYSASDNDYTIEPKMWSYLPISLREIDLNDQGTEELTVNLYLNDVLVKKQTTQFENKSIINKTIPRAVILPFKEVNTFPKQWDQQARDIFQNTLADAIFCETARIFPDTLPHYVVEQKIGKTLDRKCHNSQECIHYLKDIFGECLLIFGEISIQKVQIDTSSLTVNIYNPKSNEIKKFHFFQSYNYTFATLMHDLVKGIVEKEEFRDYLINM